jgi:hypothetical protein
VGINRKLREIETYNKMALAFYIKMFEIAIAFDGKEKIG